MYKLWNKLFGWDYVYWSNGFAQGIARVYSTPAGGVYYYRYKNINLIDSILHRDQVLWLTCNPSKYGFM